MLNIKEVESTNTVRIAGILKELEITEGTTSEGKDYVSAKATIKVDQEINGEMIENEIPVRMFSMKLKKDNSPNKIYQTIMKYRDDFTSLAACPEDHPEMASKVIINTGRLEENVWVDPNTGEVRTNFQISTNFLNKPRNSDFTEESTFELSGVVLGKVQETDVNGEETGRLKIKFAVVRYNGRVDVINLIAAGNAANFIEANWEEGDTVNLNGAVSINQSTQTYYEEQGFGDPIKRVRTETRRELIILGGSPAGLEESYSYDANDIRNALSERQERVEEMKNKTSNAKRNQASKKNQFGF